MESYTTILKRADFEYEDRKSVFIAESMPVETEAEALQFIASVKKKYPDAKHHVYAYVLRQNSIMRFSDDREPQGTAGMPVLDVIRKNGCTDTVIVVVRYFGGTLLGTGGLVKAYTSAAIGALAASEIITYDIYSDFSILVSYSDYQKILPLFPSLGFRIDDTKFTDNVIISGRIKKSHTDDFIKSITESTAGRVTAELVGEKFDF